ncbi:MAG: heme o synthase [Verrucomicrobiia bacterium]
MAPADLGKTSWLSVILDLTKFRLTSLVLLTTLVGFYIGEKGSVRYGLLLNTLLGTGLVASGAAALNQLLEKDYDALMKRTRSRPLPAGRLQPETVLVFGLVTAVIGLLHLALAVNFLTAALGAITLVTYVCVYTPLKRVTPLNTVIGAVPGALPPLMGWAAARGAATIEGWSLFGILFLWQLPHFMAISWLYREEYARAGFAMLSVYDPEGIRTGRQAVASALGLLPVSLCPFVLQIAGPWYCLGALVLGGAFLALAVRFSFQLTREHARRLFYASILYLPVLLGLLVLDKVR